MDVALTMNRVSVPTFTNTSVTSNITTVSLPPRSVGLISGIFIKKKKKIMSSLLCKCSRATVAVERAVGLQHCRQAVVLAMAAPPLYSFQGRGLSQFCVTDEYLREVL